MPIQGSDAGTSDAEPLSERESLELQLEQAVKKEDFARAAEIQEDQLNQLRLLRPPEEDQEAVSQALPLLGQISQIAKDSRDSLAAGDIAQLQELAASIEPLQAESTQIAQDLGLQVCGADDE